MFWAYSYLYWLCYACYSHSSLLMNAIFGSTSLSYGSCIQLSNRTDRTNRQPSSEHDGSTAPFNGSFFFVDPYGLYNDFFGSCQLESTRNINVCLLYCATLFPVVNKHSFRRDSLFYGSCIKNYPIVRIEGIDNPPFNLKVVNGKQFSDRQLYLTGGLYLSICTGCTMAFSDRVS